MTGDFINCFPEFLKPYTMGITDTINYVLFKNPVSSTVIDSGKAVGNTLWYYGAPQSYSTPPPPVIPKQLLELPVHRIVYGGSTYVRIAGLSGALAVLLGAYGAHSLLLKQGPAYDDRKRVYETANRYHFMHTLALLAAPLARKPKLVCTVMLMGMSVFCGTCYYDAFSGDTSLRKYTPVGGSLLVLGWVCFML